ncbi:hypothetical protein EYC80_005287 [Monilinia laxa]|uniref:Uncharacterized protein n=1 Tax=Monilinia laxa TaxID=61186 RepID=A0A5N6KJR2_MONLA|nr:hypothetical protein EYC80_005287 [Monilinia laxa]
MRRRGSNPNCRNRDSFICRSITGYLREEMGKHNWYRQNPVHPFHSYEESKWYPAELFMSLKYLSITL